MLVMDAQEILDFWFDPQNADLLFATNKEFDQKIKDKFYDVWVASSYGLLAEWRKTVHGRLAEIIVMDQFSRNLHRGKPESFSQDLAALILAQELLEQEDYHTLNDQEKHFGLMPFMHSESPQIQNLSVTLFQELGNDNTIHYAKLHEEVIQKFGRFPGRNDALGRQLTAAELEYIHDPDRKF